MAAWFPPIFRRVIFRGASDLAHRVAGLKAPHDWRSLHIADGASKRLAQLIDVIRHSSTFKISQDDWTPWPCNLHRRKQYHICMFY
jgi:hypothetical protein